jgi:hypothetical protein
MPYSTSLGRSPRNRRRWLATAALLLAVVVAVMIAAEPWSTRSGGASASSPGRRNLLDESSLVARNRMQTWRSTPFAAHPVFVHVYAAGHELHQSLLGGCHASYVGQQVVAVVDLMRCRSVTGPDFIRLHYANLGARRRLSVRVTRSAQGVPGARAATLSLSPNG